jgi:hypothetical protein
MTIKVFAIPQSSSSPWPGHRSKLEYNGSGDETITRPAPNPTMSTNCQIYPATPAHLPAIHAIYSHSVLHGTASWELTPPDEGEMARRISTIFGQGFPYFVAEVDGVVVGYTYASSYRPRPGYRFTVENSIYVASGHQGRGR